MNENQNLLLAGLFQMVAALVPLFKKAGAAGVSAELEAILSRADSNYRDVITVADERTHS